LQVRGAKRDTRERPQNRFRRLASHDPLISRQQEHSLVTSRDEDESRRTERRDHFESHRRRPFESRDQASAETTSASAAAQSEFGRKRARAAARLGGVCVNLGKIRER
jgi:hypothetical protein